MLRKPGCSDVSTSRVRHYLEASQAENTRRSYLSDLRHFREWCEVQGVDPVPVAPEALAAYLVELADAGLAVSTLERRIAAIAALHRAVGHDPPQRHEAVRLVWRGIRRTIGTAPRERKRPLVLAELLAVVGQIGKDRLIDLRDRALLLIGWSMGARRSELAALDAGDLEHCEQGVLISIRRSKTDQEGSGRLVPIRRRSSALCPVAALDAWCSSAELGDGALWCTVDRHGRAGARIGDRGIARAIKRRIAAAGLDASQYGAHSLRSGLCVSAKAGGASEIEIMRITGHRSLRGLSTYLEAADVWQYDPAGMAGL